MYCPGCGQEQIAEETRFCSRCGFLLLGVAEVMNNGGAIPSVLSAKKLKGNSQRKKGIKQGLFIFLLTFLVVPIISIITLAVDAEPYAVVISAILLLIGGLLRMIYAWMFESDEPSQTASEQNVLNEAHNFLGKAKSENALPPAQSIPASSYIPPTQGNWRDTNDLAQPSVAEGTTKLLKEE